MLAVLTVVDDCGDARKVPKGVRQILERLWDKKNVNMDASQANNHGIYEVFCLKVFTISGRHLAKTLVFTQFSACEKKWQKGFFRAKVTKLL